MIRWVFWILCFPYVTSLSFHIQKLLCVSGRLRREKKKARVGTRFPLSNVPHASTIFIFITIVFFSWNPYVHYFVFVFTWFISIM